MVVSSLAIDSPNPEILANRPRMPAMANACKMAIRLLSQDFPPEYPLLASIEAPSDFAPSIA
jgi:hypothetical protein